MTDLATLARPHERVARLGLDVVCEEVCETGNEALLITALIGDVKWNGWEMPRIHRTEWECVASMQANATGDNLYTFLGIHVEFEKNNLLLDPNDDQPMERYTITPNDQYKMDGN